MKFLQFATMAALGLAVAHGQTMPTPDNSGNALLKGKFNFRHVAVQNVDANGNPTQVTASSGVITFDGAGKYSVVGTSVDNTVSKGTAQPLTVSGTYAIGANGLGYIDNPLYPTDALDSIYGAIAQGVFSGSSTESGGENFILNDIFVAIPAGTAPTNATFTSPYQVGLLDFTGAGSTAIKNALFELTPNGKGGFGSIALTGQASNQTATTVSQTIAGATYSFNADGSATLTAPLPTGVTAANALFTGAKTAFVSADGNFVLGWSASGFDIFFGVKALTSQAANSINKGLYFTASLEDSPAGNGTDSFYGSISGSGDSLGDEVVHQRLNFAGSTAYDLGTDDQLALNADGTTMADFNGYLYIFGDGGSAFVGIGTYGTFSLVVGTHAANFSGPGVYLNPIGVVNAASYAPITASLAPGELITLFGSGLAAANLTAQGGQAFPTSLGGVSVTINSVPCPIYYVTPTQLSVIVPYEVSPTTTYLANIQVNNNGIMSNTVQMYLSDTAPGSFSTTQNGIGYAAALHAATGLPVTTANPAQKSEYLSLFLTGLGTVTPVVKDGGLGPSSPLSTADQYTSMNLMVYFNDYYNGGSPQANIQFAGLAPDLAGLYQINVQVPSGLGAGDNVYVEFVTDSADVNQIQIPYGTSSGGVSRAVRSAMALRPRGGKPITHPITHRERRQF